MSNAELEALIIQYLEGSATRAQVVRLRDAIKSSPEMHQRFQARLRLHRAQMAYLADRDQRSPGQAMLWLHAFAQRAGRSFAHLCLLALVFVELQVRIPAEYSGFVLYAETSVADEMPDMGDMPVLTEAPGNLAALNLDLPNDLDLPAGEVHDMVIPRLDQPDLLQSADAGEPTVV
jgi:hypothetical protein